ncbi:MAG TPA: hypothetical protein VF858_04480 [Gemmatimonadaceae bacterium]
MKAFAITLALAGVATAAPMSAQVVARTVPVTNRPACVYTRTTNSVGDIIFGRTSDVNCRDVSSREEGGWYQVGRGPDNNSIYVRRVRDANGNLVIQRARRNPGGTFTIFSTRPARSGDKEWKKALKEQRKTYKRAEKAEDKQMKDRLEAGTISKDQYDAWKKADKEQDKVEKASMKANEKAQKEAWKESKGKGKK